MLGFYNEIIKSMDNSETLLTKEHINTITKLPQKHIEIIYLIMLHYNHLNSNNKNNKKIPYKGKTISSSKGVIFKQSFVPQDLQKIIHRYLINISR